MKNGRPDRDVQDFAQFESRGLYLMTQGRDSWLIAVLPDQIRGRRQLRDVVGNGDGVTRSLRDKCPDAVLPIEQPL